METLEQWLTTWENLTEPTQREAYLNEIPEYLNNEAKIQAIKAWWNVRYFYADKNKTRLGDRFVWLLLSMRGQANNKVGKREMLKVYKNTFDNTETEIAIAFGDEELKNQLYSAAELYVSTIGEPSPILGIIPRKDKSPADKSQRIAKLIVEDHLQTIWKAGKDLTYMPIVGHALYSATKNSQSIMAAELNQVTDLLQDEDFKAWLKQVIV